MSHHWIEKFGQYSVNMDTLLTMWISMAILLFFAFISTRKLSLVPSKIQSIAEGVVGAIAGLADQMIGTKDSKKHVPLFATLFLFIATANLIGQIPWKLYHLKTGELASPTNDINMTASMALLVVVYYLYQGFRLKGFKLLLHDLSPMGIMMFFIELMDIVTRPFSLALRLFANILAGEILIATFVGMCAIILPLPFMLFEVVVAIIQALVFTLLTAVYIGLAVQQHEH